MVNQGTQVLADHYSGRRPFLTILAPEVPEGFELTGEHRPPRLGEWFLTCSGHARTAHENDHVARLGSRFILKKLWQPPAWLPGGCWIYRSGCGDKAWYVSSREPLSAYVDGYWRSPDSDYSHCSAITLAEIHGEVFDPPPVNKVKVIRIG